MFFLAKFFPEAVVEVLYEVSFSAKEEILHGLEMIFEMELIFEHFDKDCSYFFMSLAQPFSKEVAK